MTDTPPTLPEPFDTPPQQPSSDFLDFMNGSLRKKYVMEEGDMRSRNYVAGKQGWRLAPNTLENNIVASHADTAAGQSTNLPVTPDDLASVGAIWTGQNLVRYAARAIASQAQSITTTMFTLSGIADGDAGLIHASYGGNINTIDRESNNVDIAFFRTGGNVNLKTTGFGTTGLGHMTIGSANSSGNLVISAITDAFGAGSFTGVFYIVVLKNTPGIAIS